jgi:hypothetical protein
MAAMEATAVTTAVTVDGATVAPTTGRRITDAPIVVLMATAPLRTIRVVADTADAIPAGADTADVIPAGADIADAIRAAADIADVIRAAATVAAPIVVAQSWKAVWWKAV